MNRRNHVMLRLSDEEHEAFLGKLPPGEDKAVFARKLVLSAVADGGLRETLRRSAAFVVACLSPEITFEEAVCLFDEHVPAGTQKEVAHGGHD